MTNQELLQQAIAKLKTLREVFASVIEVRIVPVSKCYFCIQFALTTHLSIL